MYAYSRFVFVVDFSCQADHQNVPFQRRQAKELAQAIQPEAFDAF